MKIRSKTLNLLTQLPDACVAAVHRPRSRGVPPSRPTAGSQTLNHGYATPALRNGFSARVKGDG